MNYLKKFTETAIYNAYSRGIAMDFTIGKINFIEPRLLDAIEKKWGRSIEELMKTNSENQLELKQCIDELIGNKIIFISNENDLFPDVNYIENNYSIIENIHIVFNKLLMNYKDSLIGYINNFKIKASKFNFKNCDQNEIIGALDFFSHSNLESIECVFDYNINKVNNLFLEQIIASNGAITRITISNLPKNFEHQSDTFTSVLDEDLFYPKFVASFKLFTESQNFNTYFNKKLFIGENGEIKNAPESNKIYGYLKDMNSIIEMKNIILTSEFQKLWYLKKDNIDVCKDCEFRHICVDSRLPFKRNKNDWYHKNECNYNPYICKWVNEDGYQTLEECGVISNETGFSIDHEEIAKINADLWSEEEVASE